MELILYCIAIFAFPRSFSSAAYVLYHFTVTCIRLVWYVLLFNFVTHCIVVAFENKYLSVYISIIK